jgi:DNA-binding MarR family transcriptional regulator
MSTIPDYRSLAELRYQIRRFLHFSEQASRQARVEPRQHQLLLALKGLPETSRPTIGVVSERLQIRPHSAVELANRLAKRGFVRRQRGSERDRREVLLSVTAKGEKILRELSLYHREELRSAGPALMRALQAVLKAGRTERPKASTGGSVRRRSDG